MKRREHIREERIKEKRRDQNIWDENRKKIIQNNQNTISANKRIDKNIK